MTTTSSVQNPIDEHDAPSDAAPSRRRPARSMRQWVRLVAMLAAVVLAGVVVARVATTMFRPHLYSGTVLQSPTPPPSMDGLELANGQPFEIASYEGDVVLLYFGYTNCPDVCPTTLSSAAQVRAGLDENDQDRVHLAMISVDPDRDPIDTLQTYVEFFDEDFLAVGGDKSAIDRAAAGYGIYSWLGEPEEDGSYTVDHTAGLLGIGPDGRLRVVWGPDVANDALSADIVELLGT